MFVHLPFRLDWWSSSGKYCGFLAIEKRWVGVLLRVLKRLLKVEDIFNISAYSFTWNKVQKKVEQLAKNEIQIEPLSAYPVSHERRSNWRLNLTLNMKYKLKCIFIFLYNKMLKFKLKNEKRFESFYKMSFTWNMIQKVV